MERILGMNPEVLLFIVDAGGGHRSAANALLAASEQTKTPFRLVVVNLQRVLNSLDFFERLTGLSIEGAYNQLIQRRSTLFLVPILGVLHGAIRLRFKALCRVLGAYLVGQNPSAVVSLAPNFNAVIRDAVRVARPGVPFLVILTDLADFPPHFWIEPGIDRVIVGSDEAVTQALAAGIPDERITRTSGMILHPRFYEGGARDSLRRELGIPEDGFVVLVLFGGKGSPEMLPLSRLLLQESSRWHIVAICGDNPRLLGSMAPLEASASGRLRAIGFTDRVADYMAAADLLVTKPGPGSLAEALHRKLPVVVTCNLYTVPQERFNARFIEKEGLGLVVKHWREIPGAAARIAWDPEFLERVRENISRLPPNRAVYEALEIIGRELKPALATPAL
jgi:hypothetical protein